MERRRAKEKVGDSWRRSKPKKKKGEYHHPKQATQTSRVTQYYAPSHEQVYWLASTSVSDSTFAFTHRQTSARRLPEAVCAVPGMTTPRNTVSYATYACQVQEQCAVLGGKIARTCYSIHSPSYRNLHHTFLPSLQYEWNSH